MNISISKTFTWAFIVAFTIYFWVSIGGAFAQTAWTNIGNGLQTRVVSGFREYRFTTITGYQPYGVTDSLNKKADTSTVVHRSGTETITGTKLFNAGIVANGVVGSSGTDRADAQLELNNNITGGHTLLALHNNLPADESAITYSSILSNGDIKQIGAGFARFVNGVNTYNAYETVYGFHLPSYPKDNTPLLLFSNNSVRLLGGGTTGAPWNDLPPDNTLDIKGDVIQSGDLTMTKSTPKINIVGTQSGGRSYTLTSSIQGVSNSGFSIRDNTSGVNVLVIDSGGDCSLSGSLTTSKYKLSALNTAPSSSTDTGATGEIRVTSDYIYVCIATSTWVRTPLATW